MTIRLIEGLSSIPQVVKLAQVVGHGGQDLLDGVA